MHKSISLILVTPVLILGCLLSSNAQTDIGVLNLRFEPLNQETLVHPDRVYFTLVNYGPQSNCDVQMEFTLSRNNTPGDADDTPWASFVHTACLNPLQGINDSLSVPERVQLTMPSDASGDYYVLVKATPIGNLDPDLSDNISVTTNKLTVPPVTSIYASFANSLILTSNIDITPSSGFSYNSFYGNCWRILQAGEGFTASFTVTNSGNFTLRLRHATSFSQSCPNNGYAPVNITINGNTIATEYDVAANHASYWFEDDTWTFQATQGLNTLEIYGGSLCTHYWLQRIEILPLFQAPLISAFSRAQDGRVEMTILGTAGRTNVIEFSVDLLSWSPLTNLLNDTGTLSWTNSSSPPEMGFYRVAELLP